MEMAVIKKKIWPKYFELIKSGRKKFELRLADFKIKEGDTLVLEEWNPKTKTYTGRKLGRKVKYLFRFNLNDFGQAQAIVQKGLFIIQI